ncbi:GNAT family N-acetyltransferase [Litchfieldia alkalitelluris]|uniref:GNAT family N-acetyltransferase n=1 Tax=Litchfieldia alkalitelluris TaxID=304268 RepID=UPI00099841ED|nr:GNAT family N-acetyltransferase [Litchfieldia alkalitelluris]
MGHQQTEEEGVLEFLYHYRKDTWGKGYASETAEVVLLHGIKLAKPKGIRASVAIENIGSWKILEKLGLRILKKNGQKKHKWSNGIIVC